MTEPITARLLTFIEQYFLLYGEVPSFRTTEDTFQDPEFTTEVWQRHFKDPDFRNALLRRGIILREFEKVSQNRMLTEEQLFCVNTLLDFTDRRSKSKKLADMNISTSKYQSWLKDQNFQNYIRARSENGLLDNMHDVHGGLLDAATRGDTSAIKLYYELTGRHSNQTNNVDLLLILTKILEIIQVHLSSQPQVIEAISNDLASLLPNSQPKALAVGPVGNGPVGKPYELEGPDDSDFTI